MTMLRTKTKQHELALLLSSFFEQTLFIAQPVLQHVVQRIYILIYKLIDLLFGIVQGCAFQV